MIFFPYDYSLYAVQKGFLIDCYEDLPGPFAHSEEELMEEFMRAENRMNQDPHEEKAMALVNRFHRYQDGISSERLLNDLKTC